jgi:hypothetical protein
MRVCANDLFSIQLEDETQHAVSSRMLRTLDDKSGGNSIGYRKGGLMDGKAYKVDGEMADCWINHACLVGLVLVDLARIIPSGPCRSTLHLLGQLDMQILVGSNRDELLAGIGGRVVGAAGAAERDGHPRPSCRRELRWRAQRSAGEGAGWPAETSSDARH